MVLARCIPHHLNEEIFQVCELALELKIGLGRGAKEVNDGLREAQVNSLIEALTDKFTMRSKAHKRLIKMSDNDVLGLVVVLANAVAASPEAMGKLLKLLAQKSADVRSLS